ncbi:hypothetical protein Tco_0708587 [Tanacetum coccineum]
MPSSSSKFRHGISCIDVLRDLLDVFVPGVRVCDEFVGVAVMIGVIRVDLMTRIVVESVAFTFHWIRFVEDSGYQNMATLHFIHESAHTFYVTGYGISGSESGGYDELLTGGRMTRCFARLGQNLLAGDFISDIESDTLNVTVNGNIFTVTHRRQLLPGSIVFGKTFAMMVFATDGWELPMKILTVLTWPLYSQSGQQRTICRWAGHDRHFDESDTFYRPLLAHVTNKGRLTIPVEFVRKHELYTYDHAILHQRGV